MMGAGDTFDRYTIEALIGEGGMGRVYRAYDPKLQRRVALKVLSVSPSSVRGANPSEGAVRMQREARAAAALDHPNAVAIFDVGEVEGAPFIAMELVDGESLRAFIGAPGIAWDRRLRWLSDVASALAAAHRRGLVHRDVKPENVMVRDDDVIKVLDFGIAKRHDDPVDPTGETQHGGISAITGAGVIVGTPHYMSPEQMRGDALDGRSDQFSWGVLAYELLSGRTPWKRSDDSLANVAERLTRDPAPLDLEALPPVVEHAVRRALERSRDDRYPSMDALMKVLEPFVAGSSARNLRVLAADDEEAPSTQPEVATDPSTSKPSLEEAPSAAVVTPKKSRDRRWLPVALLAVAAVSIGVIAVRRRPADGGVATATSAASSAAPRPTALPDLPEPKTANPEALAAYRLAMQAYRDGVGATDPRFRRVIELDPTIAEAHMRLADALFQTSPTEARAAFARATELRASLSERDQAVLRAAEPWFVWHPADHDERMRRLREVIAKYPLDADLRYQLGAAANESHGAEQLATFEKAVELDPKFARAWWQLGQGWSYKGDFARARDALGRCLEVAAAATSCLWNRIVIDEVEGRCDAVEADARRWTSVDGADPLGYFALAAALHARGRPTESVDQALRKQEAALPASERAREVELNRIRSAFVRGDFASVEKHARALETMLEAAGAESEHQALARAKVEALLESGRSAEAARYAEHYLARREAWAPDTFAEDFAIANDVVIPMLSALRRGGAIQAAAFEARRQAWLADWVKRTTPSWHAYLWIHAWAATVETNADATRALTALGVETLPAFVPKTLAPALIGHTYLLAGRVDEALPLLQRGAASCLGLELPWEHTRAQLWLGLAREQKGDVAGACRSYGIVIERWGQAKPRSVTADEARAHMKTLRCP